MGGREQVEAKAWAGKNKLRVIADPVEWYGANNYHHQAASEGANIWNLNYLVSEFTTLDMPVILEDPSFPVGRPLANLHIQRPIQRLWGRTIRGTRIT